LFIGCSFGEKNSPINTTNFNNDLIISVNDDVIDSSKVDLLKILIHKIENNDFSYLSDTLYGECLLYAFEKYDEEGILTQDYVLKEEIKNNPNKLADYKGINLIERVLENLYSIIQNNKSLEESVISVYMLDSEFDSSCIVEFKLVDDSYKLVRVYGVG
jgi:hypothetical protein